MSSKTKVRLSLLQKLYILFIQLYILFTMWDVAQQEKVVY